jgi:hypothetical protein
MLQFLGYGVSKHRRLQTLAPMAGAALALLGTRIVILKHLGAGVQARGAINLRPRAFRQCRPKMEGYCHCQRVQAHGSAQTMTLHMDTVSIDRIEGSWLPSQILRNPCSFVQRMPHTKGRLKERRRAKRRGHDYQ